MLSATAFACGLGLLFGCGGSPAASTTPQSTDRARAAGVQRAEAVQRAVSRWSRATTLQAAQAAAEEARNLVTGPHVPGAGDANGDGRVKGVSIGLLPGADGGPGLASELASGCVQRDVLGGSWADPQQRWNDVIRRIEEWTPQNNPFPELPSHAQRVVGWASLTLKATRLNEAHEYSRHAADHARVVIAAITDPSASPCPGG